MKVLHVIEATLGGTARHIVDLSEGMLEAQHEVHLVYSSLRADQSFQRGLRELHASGFAFHSHDLRAKRTVGADDFRVLLELQRYVREHGPFDVVHSHSTKAGFLARLLPRHSRTISVYSPHALMTQDPKLGGVKRWAVSALESMLARRCDRVIAISAMERQCAVDTGIPDRKLTILNNGSKPRSAATSRPWSEIRAELGLADESFCIGTIGLLVENKEHSRLLDAFADFQRTYTDPTDLIVIGWGPMEAALRAKARALDIESRVHFLGQVHAREYLPAFDVLAHPSRYEGFAYTFLEAMDAGVPILTTNVGAAAETVLNDVTGYICDPWDTAAFAKYLVRLAEDPGKRRAMGQAGKAHVGGFTADRMVRETLGVYGDCLKKRASTQTLAEAALSRESE